MSKNETSCSCGNSKYIGREVCYECYAEMFDNYKKEEPEFELKHEVATIKATNNSELYVVNGSSSIIFPKCFVFNKDARAKDYQKLIEFILSNMVVTDHSPGFDKVSWMFKEVGK